ncbi:hypothetical protein ENHAE0001_1552 [Enhydrobacter aerosaccus SK60]|nr:hypothetical protein ENHAE0001_1552 [Enhydrobacter aerosaccus SK60]
MLSTLIKNIKLSEYSNLAYLYQKSPQGNNALFYYNSRSE